MYQYPFPKEKKIRLIVDTDAKNEADDQFAVVHHLLSPKFEIRALIAAHFEDRGEGDYDAARNLAPGTSMRESYQELEKILELMDMQGRYPVLEGATLPMENLDTPSVSEGARFIVEEAMREDEVPLFVVFLGNITDLASAYLMEPKIAERMTAVWIGGGPWPEGGVEFNLMQDVHAANVVFGSQIPLWQVPQNAYLQVQATLAELELRVRPCGKIGKYLCDQLNEFNSDYARYLPDRQGDTWCLGDQPTASVFFDGNPNNYDELPAPGFDKEMNYIHGLGNRKIRVYHSIDVRLTLEDFYAKLALAYG